jgi:hypothetical protein
MADHDERRRDEEDTATAGEMLGGIARGPITQTDADREIARSTDRDAHAVDPADDAVTRAEDRSKYGVPDPNQGLNVRD